MSRRPTSPRSSPCETSGWRARLGGFHDEQDGQIVVLVLFLAIAFVTSVFLVVNSGRTVNARIEAQNAIDASVVSGASSVARGMNYIASNNITQAKLVASIVMLRALKPAVFAATNTLRISDGIASGLMQGGPIPYAAGVALKIKVTLEKAILRALQSLSSSAASWYAPPFSQPAVKLLGRKGVLETGTGWVLLKVLSTAGRFFRGWSPVVAQFTAAWIYRQNVREADSPADNAILLPLYPALPVCQGPFHEFRDRTKHSVDSFWDAVKRPMWVATTLSFFPKYYGESLNFYLLNVFAGAEVTVTAPDIEEIDNPFEEGEIGHDTCPRCGSPDLETYRPPCNIQATRDPWHGGGLDGEWVQGSLETDLATALHQRDVAEQGLYRTGWLTSREPVEIQNTPEKTDTEPGGEIAFVDYQITQIETELDELTLDKLNTCPTCESKDRDAYRTPCDVEATRNKDWHGRADWTQAEVDRAREPGETRLTEHWQPEQRRLAGETNTDGLRDAARDGPGTLRYTWEIYVQAVSDREDADRLVFLNDEIPQMEAMSEGERGLYEVRKGYTLASLQLEREGSAGPPSVTGLRDKVADRWPDVDLSVPDGDLEAQQRATQWESTTKQSWDEQVEDHDEAAAEYALRDGEAQTIIDRLNRGSVEPEIGDDGTPPGHSRPSVDLSAQTRELVHVGRFPRGKKWKRISHVYPQMLRGSDWPARFTYFSLGVRSLPDIHLARHDNPMLAGQVGFERGGPSTGVVYAAARVYMPLNEPWAADLWTPHWRAKLIRVDLDTLSGALHPKRILGWEHPKTGCVPSATPVRLEALTTVLRFFGKH